MDNTLALFVGTIRQYAQQLDPEIVNYLVETFRMGQQDVAFTGFVSALVDLGYDENQLLQGPLYQLAQTLGVDINDSVPADPAAVRATGERPDPFAQVVAAFEQDTTPLPPIPIDPEIVATADTSQQQPPGPTLPALPAVQAIDPATMPVVPPQPPAVPTAPVDLPAVPQPEQVIQPSTPLPQPPNEDGVLHIR